MLKNWQNDELKTGRNKGGRHSELIFGTLPPYLKEQRKPLIKVKSNGFRTKILKRDISNTMQDLLPTAEGPPVCLMTKRYCDHALHLQVFSVQS